MAVNIMPTIDINQVLPPEIVEKILSYLSIEEKMESCEGVCRQWQKAVHHSTRCLAFGEIMDVFHGFHEHAIDPKNGVYRSLSKDVIISNYGRNLHMFQGSFISCDVMRNIAGLCTFLHCLDVDVIDLEILNILGETFGQQLTCVTLRLFGSCDIAPLLSKCSKLTSLATVLDIDYGRVTTHEVINLFDLTTGNPKPFLFAKSLRNLVVGGYASEEMLNHLKMFTELEMFSFFLHSDTNQCRCWASLMQCLYKLKCLHVNFSGDIQLNVKCLPSTLEYLSLERIGMHRNGSLMFDIDQSQQMEVSIFLPNLKSLYIHEYYIHPISIDDLEFYLNSFSGCAELENLAISCVEGSNMDRLVPNFLLFSSLKQLAVRSEFILSDSFASELITKHEHLTHLGRTRTPATNYDYCDLSPRFQDHWNISIPCGQGFWNALKTKAIACPNDVFTITGRTIAPLHLCDSSFPSNISLVLEGSAFLKLSNGFAKSRQWEKWVRQWHVLDELYIELKDVDFGMRHLPSRLCVLQIKSYYDGMPCHTCELTFSTRLPFLNRLSISQQYMSNSHLLATVKCIANCCPKLKYLSLHREGPVDEGPADDYVGALFQCENLKELAVGEYITFSKYFAKHLTRKVQVIKAREHVF